MIQVAGECWATAAQIAEHIGHGLTPDAVRWWGRHDGLAKVRMIDDCGRPQVRYLLGQAIRIDATRRSNGRGRPRTVAEARIEGAAA
jgi:hypothetical protein